MAKQQSTFMCSNCGESASTWSGKCYACGEWNTLEEIQPLSPNGAKAQPGRVLDPTNTYKASKVKSERISSGNEQVDVVLGGGFMSGSVVLIAGQPGIGKSTLLLQTVYQVAKTKNVLYVSGEESTHQVSVRAKRLGAEHKKLRIASSTNADDVVATIQSKQFDLVVVDSVQTMTTSLSASAAGSISQITNCTNLMLTAAKQTGTVLLLVGHVTKEGNIAGPKILEHVVDVVLQLEGDRSAGFKVLRGVKNRFGSVSEVAIFEMFDDGMKIVKNPSEALLAERQISDGSIVLATMEGSRPILVEVQALVNRTSYGYPKRTASGIDINRLNLLIAVLERRTKLQLSEQDIYVNIVGGIKINEPAADLAVCMAIASAAKGMQLKENAVVFGEVGLSGEVRHVPFIDRRVIEAKKMGFKVAIGPKIRVGKKPALLHEVDHLRTALNSFLES